MVMGSLLLLILGPMALPAQAQSSTSTGATITVNTDADEDNTDGDCSLREAIHAANNNAARDACPAGSNSGEDVIGFDVGSSSSNPIWLGSQLPNISDAAGLVINGPRHLIGGPRLVRAFRVNPGAKLALRNLLISRFNAGNGGAIYNERGTLEVTDSTFADNRAWDFDGRQGAYGGGIHNQGTLKVANSTFTRNEAEEGGGGIYNDRGDGSRVPPGTLEVTNSTFTRNLAGGQETYEGGGGILNWGPLTVTNSTFADNWVEGYLGGLNIHTPYGADDYYLARSWLRSTILVDAWDDLDNCGGRPLPDGGYNISDDNSCGLDFVDGPGTSMSNTNPLLGGLWDHGGPTNTIALPEGSPAIDAIPEGTNGCGTDIKEDQRGEARPQGPACDIGAFEAPPDQSAPSAPLIVSPAEGSYDDDGSFSVSGSAAEAYITIELFEGPESLGTAKTDSSGQWSKDLTGVSEGSHSYTARATDRAGNSSGPSDPLTVIVDKSAPSAPAITSPANNSRDTDGNITVSGTAEANSTVELFDFTTSQGTATTNASGQWSKSLTGVAEGSHVYIAKARDAAGHTSDPSNTLTVIVKIPPLVNGVTPTNGATNVARNTNVTAIFSEEMDPSTLNDSTIKMKVGKKKVPVAISYDEATKTVTLDPYPDEPLRLLAANKRHKVLITTGVKDKAGNAPAQNYVWTFTTGPT